MPALRRKQSTSAPASAPVYMCVCVCVPSGAAVGGRRGRDGYSIRMSTAEVGNACGMRMMMLELG